MIIAEKYIQGLTIKEFIFKCLKMFGLLVFIFYYTYPQALEVRGGSFIVPSAVLGIGLYAWNRFPFVEAHKVVAFFLLFLCWCWFSEFASSSFGDFRMSYIRSQMAWFFSAYLVNFILFNVHKNPRFEVIVGYMAGAVILQCIITFVMNQNEAANEFFYSLQMQNIYDEETKEIIEVQRLMGYGTALFGAGMVAGYGLILITYLIAKLKMNLPQLIFMVTAFAFVFFIGLFSARTTSIGLGIAIGLLGVLYFIDKESNRKQLKRFFWFSILMFIFGAGLAATYFPDYTDWAFEMFDNFVETGSFSTKSSDALYHLFYLPTESVSNILIGGERSMEFWGNDMGYTRLIYYIGIVGMLFYFAYQIFIAAQMMTKDLAANILILTLIAYSLVLNIKGFTDLNPFLYLLLFYFLFHKYYRYYPSLYLKRLQQMQEAKKEKKLAEQNKELNE